MTRYTRHEAEVDTFTVTFDWAPGCEPSGMSGPPENYDPGEGDEFVVITPEGLTDEQEEAVVNWLNEHWERPVEDDGPDPDWLRDQQQDAAMDHDMTLNGEDLL